MINNLQQLPPGTRNLRYLLWRDEIPRQDWANTLAIWLNGTPERARQLLEGEPLTPDELDLLAEHTSMTGEDLAYAEPLDADIILKANLRYLLSETPHGSKQALAQQFGVDSSTFSRWLNGKQTPSNHHLSAISAYCQLPADIDLRQIPLFLSLSPVSVQEQRTWVIQRIESLDADTLRSLFPALERLLRE